MEWISFFMAASALTLALHEMENNKKVEKRMDELEKKIQG